MKAELSLPAAGARMLAFVYKMLTLAFFFSFWEWKEGEEEEISTAVRNFGTSLIRWSESWHTSWKAGQVQFFCQGWALHYPWEKLPKSGKFTGLWNISPCTFSAAALVDTDAAAPICVCLHHSCTGWVRPTCCYCLGLLGGCGGLASTNTLGFCCCCPSQQGGERDLTKKQKNAGNIWDGVEGVD